MSDTLKNTGEARVLTARRFGNSANVVSSSQRPTLTRVVIPAYRGSARLRTIHFVSNIWIQGDGEYLHEEPAIESYGVEVGLRGAVRDDCLSWHRVTRSYGLVEKNSGVGDWGHGGAHDARE